MGELPHNWNYIGYDEINYTYTPDGQVLLAKLMELQEKPYYVRTHHLLCTGNCHAGYKWGSTNVYLEDDDGNPSYDWTFTDLTFDTLLKYNCRPFVELGFMPQDLADRRHYDIRQETWTHQNYRLYGFASPPKDYEKWYDLIFNLVRHCVERYGQDEVGNWYWELWNEPDLSYYWKGSIEEFLRLYDYTAAAVKAAFPEARVGGPGVTNPDLARRSGQLLDAFCDHVLHGVNSFTGEQGTPIDFMSFHVKGGGYRADPKRRKENPPSVKRILKDTRTGHDLIARYPPLDRLECVLSEIDPDGWAAGGAWDNINLNFRNTEYYPSFVVTAFDKVSEFAREKRWDVRFLTWAFLFTGERCFEGTRALSTQGIDKPILNLFRLYSLMGDRAVSFHSEGVQDPLSYADDNGLGAPPDISGFAALSGPSALTVLIYNHHDDWDLDADQTIRLEVDNLPFGGAGVTVSHYRIDSDHSNAYAEWVRQGSPMYPTAEQRRAIHAREGLEKLEPDQTLVAQDGSLVLSFTLPVHAISLLILSPA